MSHVIKYIEIVEYIDMVQKYKVKLNSQSLHHSINSILTELNYSSCKILGNSSVKRYSSTAEILIQNTPLGTTVEHPPPFT